LTAAGTPGQASRWVVEVIAPTVRPDEKAGGGVESPESPADGGTNEGLFAGDSGDSSGGGRSEIAEWDEPAVFHRELVRTGRRWKQVPGWLNETHAAGYPAGALFLDVMDVTAEHRRLALGWLCGQVNS
jgi:hypothetical protein